MSKKKKTEDHPPLPDAGSGQYTRFEDTYGKTVTVRYSSSGEHEAVWIFTDDGRTRQDIEALLKMDQYSPPAPHLNRQQAIWVRDALTKFINEANPNGIDPVDPLDGVGDEDDA